MPHGPNPELPRRSPLPLDAAEVAALAPDDPRAEVLLTRWDELPEAELAALGAHPVLGARLARLRAAEDWLGRGLTARREAERRVPRPEELFAFAAGPAAGGTQPPLTLERRRAVERHLEAAPEEAAWVAGLERRPPSPLLFDAPRGLGALEEDELSEVAPLRSLSQRLARWVPLAVAATVLATGVLVVRSQRDTFELPPPTLVRGPLAEPLHFPRGRVLGAPEGAVGLFASEPVFEFAGLAGASTHRVELRQHGGGAFDVGTLVWSAESSGPAVTGPPLAPGRYTWEAFATADGLERSLGTLDFHVVVDAGALERLAHEPLVGQVRSLAADGLATDARHRAKLLPSGPDRDRFLGPGAAR